MSENNFKVGQAVQITNRNLTGRIAYVGLTSFSPGRWIGVVLDGKEKGKNDGTVKGVTYFKCEPNCGLFVRPTQLTSLTYTSVDCAADVHVEMDPVTSVLPSEDTVKIHISEATHSTSNALENAPAEGPTCSATVGNLSTHTNILKTTRINQPKQVKQRIFYSNSQLELRRNGKPLSAASEGATAASVPDLMAPPKRSKGNGKSAQSFCNVKRSSFVETGFLEILQPKFTPGFPMRSSTTFNMSTATARRNEAEQNERYKELESKLASLRTELEILKQQKTEDKQRLYEFEKCKLENEQLLKFKSQIMEENGLLQRDLQRLRHELFEANDCKSKYKFELDEIAENTEILTVDKEMAEERAETLQIELELAQERIEELTIDLEILRTENEDFLSVLKGDACIIDEALSTSVEIKKLEQYNQRLRETVVRLRDLLMNEKQHNQKQNKELETKSSEIIELKKSKEILSKQVDVMERHILDLNEQLDAALGAEAMVTTLADAKIDLEDRVKLLEEEVTELEALEEIQEQIIESNQELEADLREEIEELNGAIRALQREKENAMESVYDRDMTIMKFRDLVHSLNNQSVLNDPSTFAIEASTSTSNELSCSLNQETIHSIDFNHLFTATKAGGRIIEEQLSVLELKLCKSYIEHILAFVPEDLMLRGKENDVILVLLLLERVHDKIEIICQAISEKFPSFCVFSKIVIAEGFSVQRYAFRCKFLYVLKSLKMVLKQLTFGLNHCDYEICTHAAIYRGEMEAQEKHVDDLLQLLKTDMLDENTSMDSIENVSVFFNRLYTNLICSQNTSELIDAHEMYSMLVEMLDVALDCVNTSASLLHTIIQLGDESTESFFATQFIIENTNIYKQRLKKMHRKFPAAGFIFSDTQQQLCTQMHQILLANEYFGRIINILMVTVRDAKKCLSTTNEEVSSETAIDHERLWKFITTNCVKLYTEEKQTPMALFQHFMELVDERIKELSNFITEKESLKNTNKNIVFVRTSSTTLLQRSAQIKQQFEDFKTLQFTLIERDKEIKTQKYLNKLKQEELSEMQIRKEILERNYNRMQCEQEQMLTKITDLIEDLSKQIFCKEVAILCSLSVFQQKLVSLEEVFQKMEQNLLSHKLANNLTTDESIRQIDVLNKCLRRERAERIKIQVNKLKTRMSNFEPLYVPQKKVPKTADLRLTRELHALKNQWILSHITLKSSNKRTRLDIERDSNNLLQRILNTYFESHPHRLSQSYFGKFGCKELIEKLK